MKKLINFVNNKKMKLNKLKNNIQDQNKNIIQFQYKIILYLIG